MDLRDKLAKRINMRDINALCRAVSREPEGGTIRSTLYDLITDDDNCVGYNALWILTHLTGAELEWLCTNRDGLIDILLTTGHTGRRRLILTLLERMPTDKDSIRTDYLNFCLSRINSTEPYGIRALCMKQAFAQCRFYPELLSELKAELDMLSYGELSPGIATARKNILRSISKLAAPR